MSCAGFNPAKGKPCDDQSCMPCWWDALDYEWYLDLTKRAEARARPARWWHKLAIWRRRP